jgi:hypothetical protein
MFSLDAEASPGAFTTRKSFMRTDILKAEANRKMKRITEITASKNIKSEARQMKVSKKDESEQERCERARKMREDKKNGSTQETGEQTRKKSVIKKDEGGQER